MALADCFKQAGYTSDEINVINERIKKAKSKGQTDEQVFRSLVPTLEQEIFGELNSIKDQLGIERPFSSKELATQLKENAGGINNLNQQLTADLAGFDIEKEPKTRAGELKQGFVRDLDEGRTVVKALSNLRNKLGREIGSKDLPNQLPKETKEQLLELQNTRRNIINKQNELAESETTPEIDSKGEISPLKERSPEEGTLVPEKKIVPSEVQIQAREDLSKGPEFGTFTDRILSNENVDPKAKKKLREISKEAEIVSHADADFLADTYLDTNGRDEQGLENSLEDLKNLNSKVWSSGAGIGVNVAKKLAKEFKNDPVKMAQIFESVNRGVREAGRSIARLSDPATGTITPEERLFMLSLDTHTKRTKKLAEQATEDKTIGDLLDGVDLSIAEETIIKSVEEIAPEVKSTGQKELKEGKALVKEALIELRKLGLGSGPVLLSNEGVQALTKLFKGLSLQFKGNLNRIRSAWSDSLGETSDEAWNQITKTTDVLKENAKIRSQNIKDIVLDHLKSPDFNTIEQKLVLEGVNKALATKLAEKLRDNIGNELETKRSKLEEQLKPLGRAEKLTDALINIAKDGLLHEDQVRDSVLQSMGLDILSQEDFTRLNEMLDIHQKATSKRQQRTIEKQILSEISSLQASPRQQALDFALGMFYTGILSGLSTQKVALNGAGFGGILELISASGPLAFKSPKAVMKAWGRAFTPEGFGVGLQTYGDILRTGDTDNVQFLDDAPLHSMSEFQKFMNTKHKNIAKTGFKGFWQIPTYMYRNLLAMDAFINSGLTESLAYVEAANAVLANNPKVAGSSEFYNDVNRLLGITNKELLKNQVDKEIRLGLIPKNESNTRLQELILEGRHNEIQERARDRALQAILMNNEVSGWLPSLIVSTASQMQNIKEEDNPVIGSTKFMAKMLLPIVRVPANALTRAYQFSPLIALELGIDGLRTNKNVRGFLGAKGEASPKKVKAFDIKTRSHITKTLDPRDRKAQLARSALGTTMALTIFALFAGGDEDEPFIRITGRGMEDFKQNKPVLGEDYLPNRIQFRTKKGGKYSEGIKWEDIPLSWVFAPLGQITDTRLQGKEAKNGYLEMLQNSAKGVLDGSYDLSMIFLGDFFESVRAGIKNPKSAENYITNKPAGDFNEYKVYRELNRRITPFLIPRTYKHIGDLYRDLSDKPLPKTNRMTDFMLRDLGILETFFASEPVTDKFGNPIYLDFDAPFSPSALEDIIDNLWNGDNPPSKEYEILKGKSFVFPRDYTGSGIEGITLEDKKLFRDTYKRNYKEIFNQPSNVKKIRTLDKEPLNDYLDVLHDLARKKTQTQILGGGKGNLSQKYKRLRSK